MASCDSSHSMALLISYCDVEFKYYEATNMWRLLFLLFLIPGAAKAQSVTPNFTQGSMTSTTTTTQTISETIQIKVYGGDYRGVSADNMTPSGDLNSASTTYTVTDTTKPYSLEVTTRSAGIVEQTDITRSITTNSTTNSLSVFSQ